MSRLTRDGTAEPVSRDQILRSVRGQGNLDFPCSADHEQDWQPYPVDPYSAMCDDVYTDICTCSCEAEKYENNPKSPIVVSRLTVRLRLCAESEHISVTTITARAE